MWKPASMNKSRPNIFAIQLHCWIIVRKYWHVTQLVTWLISFHIKIFCSLELLCEVTCEVVLWTWYMLYQYVLYILALIKIKDFNIHYRFWWNPNIKTSIITRRQNKNKNSRRRNKGVFNEKSILVLCKEFSCLKQHWATEQIKNNLAASYNFSYFIKFKDKNNAFLVVKFTSWNESTSEHIHIFNSKFPIQFNTKYYKALILLK